MFYRVDNNGNIIDYANFQYDDSVETEKNIIRGFDGKLIFEEETQTPEYIKLEQEYTNNQNKRKLLNEYENWFEAFFRTQLEQHSWQKDYKPSADPYFKNEDGSAKTYKTFEDIIAQAELVREEIKQLRNK